MGRQIRFVETRWGRVAFSVVGSGRPLVFDTGWISDLDVMWKHDGYRGLVRRLAESHQVICFDTLGCGLSDRTAVLTALDDEVELLEAVVSAAGVRASQRVSLFCSSIAASTAVRFAARSPARVHRLVLYGGALRGRDLAPTEVRTALLKLVRAHWGLGSRALSDIFLPAPRRAELEWFNEWQRRSTDGDTAARRLQMFYESDVSDEARDVTSATLVVHRSGDRAIPLSRGTELAAALPGAALETIDGTAHPCYLGDWEVVADVVIPFLDVPDSSDLPRGPYGRFTARELDVAELTLQGMTNAEIGTRLGISARTVETHLGRIRAKLGVRTRAEVAAWMARRDGVG